MKIKESLWIPQLRIKDNFESLQSEVLILEDEKQKDISETSKNK